MFHVRDYQRALEKITAAPLELTERDFTALEQFNPGDEVRGRAALRLAQLAIVPKAAPPASRAADLGHLLREMVSLLAKQHDRINALEMENRAIGQLLVDQLEVPPPR